MSKLDFYFREILIPTQILIEYTFTITVCRALFEKLSVTIVGKLGDGHFILTYLVCPGKALSPDKKEGSAKKMFFLHNFKLEKYNLKPLFHQN